MNKIKTFLGNLLHYEQSPHKLACAFSAGIYIAFSPFPGLHTAMIFILAPLLRVNLPITFTTAYFICNPLTTIPIYSLDYALGQVIVHKVLHLNTTALTPQLVPVFNAWCTTTFGYDIPTFFTTFLHIPIPCFWSFLLGGNLLALALAGILYPIMKRVFARMTLQEISSP